MATLKAPEMSSVFVDLTNSGHHPRSRRSKNTAAVKRPANDTKYIPTRKRIKLTSAMRISDVDSTSDENDLEDVVPPSPKKNRKQEASSLNHHRFLKTIPGRKQLIPEYHSILLRSFVTACEKDALRCTCTSYDEFIARAYSCAYSNGSKQGDRPLLAIGTNQGTVEIVDTTKQEPCDAESSRKTTISYDDGQGIFEVQWSQDDTKLAAACHGGHRAIHVASVETQAVTAVLSGYAGNVKCISWDPRHPELLSSGAKDGAIRLWDLRLQQSVALIRNAHEVVSSNRKRFQQMPRGVTAVLYPDCSPNIVTSSCSSEGILRGWDIRQFPCSSEKKKNRSTPSTPHHLTATDPTTVHGTRRARGVTSMCIGKGPTAGLIFAHGADARVYTYLASTLQPFQHGDIDTSTPANEGNIFYVRTIVSPCGRYLATGSCGSTDSRGGTHLYDVSSLRRTAHSPSRVVLPGIACEDIGHVDWAEGVIATCQDDGIVRLWRPDLETAQ